MKRKLFSKGFIGSIGDDLPSLIPLFFALMIFFGAMAFAFTTINEKNVTINTYIDSLTVSRSALSDGSFASLDEFVSSQKSLVTMSNYIYGLIYLSNENDFDFENIFLYDIEDVFVKQCDNDIKLSDNLVLTQSVITETCSGDEKPFLVMSSSVLENKSDPSIILQDIKHKKYFYYLYPVTLLTPNGYKVLYLLVLVW